MSEGKELQVSGLHEKLEYAIKHYPFVQNTYSTVMSFAFRTLGLVTPADKHLVLLSSMSGDQYSDSPKVLFEAMKKDPRFKNFHYVWAFKNPEKFRVPGAKKVKIDTYAYFKTAVQARIWITNVNIERGLHFKKKDTVYLNTWHGTGPKKGGNAVKGRKDYDFSNVDIFCCDGQYTHDIFIKWFNAKDSSMLWCGRPREDELFEFKPGDRERIRRKLGVPEGKKMILYMPTWREHGEKHLNKTLWETELSDNYVVCVRQHHFDKSSGEDTANNNFWIDATNYPDVNELYLAADILISDYSSAFFDYGLLGKPMYCYAYDYDDYKKSYGLFMDLEKEFPSSVIRNEKQLIAAIKDMDYEQESKECKAYVARYVKHTENATQRCMDELYRRIRGSL